MSSIMIKPSVILSSSRTVRQAPVVHRTRGVVCRSGTSGFESAGRDLQRAANKVGDQLADNIDSAQRKAADKADDAAYEAKSARHSSKNLVDKGIDNVKEGLRDAGDKISDTASAVGDTAKDIIDDGKEALGGVKRKNVDEVLSKTE